MDEKEIRRIVHEYHQHNTQQVVNLLLADFDLRNLASVLDAETAKIYQRIIPRHAELCRIDQERGLIDKERCELAVGYAALYPTFGDDGIVRVAATWLATKPYRQARGS